MPTFEIRLINEKEKSYDRLALFIVIFNLALFLYFIFGLSSHIERIKSIGGAIWILLAWAFYYFFKSNRFRKSHAYSIAEFGITMAWINMDYWWIAAVNLFLGTLYFFATKNLIVFVGVDHINYPSFPRRKINWTELSSVILKDGLLTIDFKNNKLIQQTIDEAEVMIDERKFNEFCQLQLKTSRI